MYLLQAEFNGGDIAFQLFMFLFMLGIPAAIIMIVVVGIRNRKSRLNRIEEKLDKLLQEKD
ncbi:hypothetical protein FZC79_15990 [Rossellomorea vietnamensis]|uniref:DUF4083 domain-containing protein n=2 Tax=Rossellomorea TaxID=2837508 RepID=A0A5D4KAN4_9BACI|nr:MULTISPECIES: hypothetical protein [Rossellomorea]TYR73959.1 hypothetical protein FZC79_15990 [Rossellomorea vietnamensis]TYS82884.1 hypothetical protein FZC80_04955 [Rossellomorea aquimaris]